MVNCHVASRVRHAACVVALLCAACEPSSLLVVDVVSDLEPGEEVDEITLELSVDGEVSARRARSALGLDLSRGARIAEIDGLGFGPARLVVRALRAGETVVERETIVEGRGRSVAVTVVLSRRCIDVVCPGPDDPAGATTCQGGVCVDPHCSGAECPACTDDIDCPAQGTCGRGTCVEGACGVTLDSDLQRLYVAYSSAP